MTIKVIEILSEDSNGNKKVIAEFECSRCSGHGRLESYRSVDRGICFKCGGTGVEQKKVTVKHNEEYEMIKETTAIKPMLTKVNHENEMVRRSLMQTANERKIKREEFLEWKKREEEEQKAFEEDKKNNPDDYRFSWDD